MQGWNITDNGKLIPKGSMTLTIKQSQFVPQNWIVQIHLYWINPLPINGYINIKFIHSAQGYYQLLGVYSWGCIGK
jgi:hypothetical protein